jgi:hypothetical protein
MDGIALKAIVAPLLGLNERAPHQLFFPRASRKKASNGWERTQRQRRKRHRHHVREQIDIF